ncbi:MAG: hypothetical protein GEU26_12620 [Nitrososphaeraceae archaeon]|nr:hypothetical protein [Nitrososphaeraceae archaeon]
MTGQKTGSQKTTKRIKKERNADMKLWHNNATGELGHRVDKLRFMCYCRGKYIRSRRICKICKLAKKIDDYMLDLFKSAAEGRSSSNIFNILIVKSCDA